MRNLCDATAFTLIRDWLPYDIINASSVIDICSFGDK